MLSRKEIGMCASLFTIACVFSVEVACQTPLPTVPGPEDSSIRSELHGTLVVPLAYKHYESFDLYALPSSMPHRIELRGEVVGYDGRDQEGRIVYLTQEGGLSLLKDPCSHLRVKSLKSGDDVLIHDWGKLLATDSKLTLSLTNQQIAVVSQGNGHEDKVGLDDLDNASVEIFDVKNGKVLATHAGLYSPQLRWSSDGRYLLIAKGIGSSFGMPKGAAG